MYDKFVGDSHPKLLSLWSYSSDVRSIAEGADCPFGLLIVAAENRGEPQVMKCATVRGTVLCPTGVQNGQVPADAIRA